MGVGCLEAVVLAKTEALRAVPFLVPGVSATAPLRVTSADDDDDDDDDDDNGGGGGGEKGGDSAMRDDVETSGKTFGKTFGEGAAAAESCEAAVLSAVEDGVVAGHFPLRSHEQARGSAQEGAYAALLGAALDVAARAGCLGLLVCLKSQLREGGGHR